ncbi:glycosyltransferase [Clavibacter michiganensis]|uniref:glycosyltransferase n=1 Tax=Clavibacter michiganensis TaxID=28447 RepID=UPI0015E32056|nr:glycosyltransferase [Clavibacter michiganensis]
MTRPLRIAHVLPYLSADGAFGGPVAVAVEQCRELARQGHRVVLVAGWDGEVKFEVEGVDVRLFRAWKLPGLGFSGLVSHAMTAAIRRHARDFDVIHVHLGRHLLALSAANVCRRQGVPYVLQTHGMVIEDTRLKSRILDWLSVQRILESARAVLALTKAEASALGAVSADRAHVRLVRNGVAAANQAPRARDSRSPELLFLARLHPRKRVLAFAEAAAILHERGIMVRSAVVGPDEGDLQPLRAYMDAHPNVPITYEGSIAPGAASARLAEADVYVLPSVREVFPMTVLESMAVGTPVVLTEDCGIADELRASGAALVTDGSPEALANAIERLLESAELGASLAQGMRDSIAAAFGIQAVVFDLIACYPSTNAT